MKKWWIVPALLLALTLPGCGERSADSPASVPAPEPASTSRTQDSQSFQSAAQTSAQVMEAVSTQSSEGPLADEEVLSAYDRAVDAYSWFDLCTMPSNGSMRDWNGGAYQKVDYPGIETLEDLKTYLCGIFSSDVVADLLPEEIIGQQYCDIDGTLYVKPGARGADPYKGEITETVEKVSATAYTVNVTVEILAEDRQTVTGLECYSFPYELVGERWVFTDFQLVD